MSEIPPELDKAPKPITPALPKKPNIFARILGRSQPKVDPIDSELAALDLIDANINAFKDSRVPEDFYRLEQNEKRRQELLAKKGKK